MVTEKSNEFICQTCQKEETCSLWSQVCNMDEDWIKEAYNYDPRVQSVGVCVTYCRKYRRKKDIKVYEGHSASELKKTQSRKQKIKEISGVLGKRNPRPAAKNCPPKRKDEIPNLLKNRPFTIKFYT